MKQRTHTLVVGATGYLGAEVVRLVAGSGRTVRAMVRAGTPAAKREVLETIGAELCVGDLKDVSSLDDACKNVEAVVSTASATLSRQDGDSIETVDQLGQVNLIEAGERQGVRHFVFVSFPPVAIDFALQRAKRATETRLRESKLSFTVLQPTFFSELWFSPAVGFDPSQARLQVFGSGHGLVSWISLHDVARFASAATEGGAFAGRTLPLGGPDPLTQLQVANIFEELGAPKFEASYLSESVLDAQLANASNSVEEAFAALMLVVSRGLVVDSNPALELLPGRLTTVRDFAGRLMKR